jgi:hypothetical protein
MLLYEGRMHQIKLARKYKTKRQIKSVMNFLTQTLTNSREKATCFILKPIF